MKIKKKTRFYIDFSCWTIDGKDDDDAFKKAKEMLANGEPVEISGVEPFEAFQCPNCGEWEELVSQEKLCWSCEYKEREKNEKNNKR